MLERSNSGASMSSFSRARRWSSAPIIDDSSCGAPRIRGKPLKLGVSIAQRSVAKYMTKATNARRAGVTIFPTYGLNLGLDWRRGPRVKWLRGLDLNQRPSGYEPDEM